MRILAVKRQICVLYGFCSPHEDSDSRAKSCKTLTIAFILINLVMMEWTSTMYALHQLVMANISELLSAILQLAATTSALELHVDCLSKAKYTNTL